MSRCSRMILFGSALMGICFACLAAATHPTTAATKREVPDAAAQTAMKKLIHELYAKEYSDHTPAGRQKLASRLLEQASQTREDLTARYVLWEEATDLACQGDDAATAMRALTLMDRDFRIDGPALKEAALRQIVRTIRTAPQAQAAAREAMNLADEAIVNQDEATADRCILLAEAAANKSREVKLALAVRDRKKELAALKLEHRDFDAAEAKVRTGQGDAEDRLCIGRRQCFIVGDWAGGLPMLAGGSDTGLRESAETELAAKSGDILACMAVANHWWDQAARQNRLERRQILRHAAEWYRRARPGLSGVNLEIAEKRLAQVPLTAAQIAGLLPGLTTDIFSGQQFEHFLVRRIDPQINFNWGTEAIGPTLPKDDFSLQWRGYLLTEREGLYTFVLLANSGGRVVVDGQTVIDSDKLSHSRKGARVQLRLSAGAHALRVACWDGGGTAKAILQWIVPGESEPAVVPPEALRRE